MNHPEFEKAFLLDYGSGWPECPGGKCAVLGTQIYEGKRNHSAAYSQPGAA